MFIYSIDEYFINKILLKYWFSKNNSIGIFYFIPTGYKLYFKNIITDDIKNNPKFIDFAKELLRDKYKPNLDINKLSLGMRGVKSYNSKYIFLIQI